MNNKETILLATFDLASENGLGNVSLSQIAKKVGIQKASLYSHFSSKEDLINCLYEFLRERAKNIDNNEPIDYGKMVSGQDAREVLHHVVENYIKITTDKNMRIFYKFIMSERVFSKEAAKIMITETEKMILATKQLFYAMQIHKVMNFKNIDMAAVCFAMTIHSLIDYQNDKMFVGGLDMKELISEYIDHFYETYNRRELNEKNID